MTLVAFVETLLDALLAPEPPDIHRVASFFGPPARVGVDGAIECATQGSAFREARVERFRSVVCGISFRNEAVGCPRGRPELCEVEWSSLPHTWGKPREQPMALDDWGGAIPFGFRVARGTVTGGVVLFTQSYLVEPERWFGEEAPLRPRIEEVIVRRNVRYQTMRGHRTSP